MEVEGRCVGFGGGQVWGSCLCFLRKAGRMTQTADDFIFIGTEPWTGEQAGGGWNC